MKGEEYKQQGAHSSDWYLRKISSENSVAKMPVEKVTLRMFRCPCNGCNEYYTEEDLSLHLDNCPHTQTKPDHVDQLPKKIPKQKKEKNKNTMKVQQKYYPKPVIFLVVVIIAIVTFYITSFKNDVPNPYGHYEYLCESSRQYQCGEYHICPIQKEGGRFYYFNSALELMINYLDGEGQKKSAYVVNGKLFLCKEAGCTKDPLTETVNGNWQLKLVYLGWKRDVQTDFIRGGLMQVSHLDWQGYQVKSIFQGK